jgi:agarase
VPTQAARAAAYRDYAATALDHPHIVGAHWFEHADQPAQGRFDGENSNFGTVSIEDRIYAELTDAMTAVNTMAESLHAAAEPVT